MGFLVEPDVFAALPSLCIGVLVADGIDNTGTKGNAGGCDPSVRRSNGAGMGKFDGTDSKHTPTSLPRGLPETSGHNPNKFASSIESPSSRC